MQEWNCHMRHHLGLTGHVPRYKCPAWSDFTPPLSQSYFFPFVPFPSFQFFFILSFSLHSAQLKISAVVKYLHAIWNVLDLDNSSGQNVCVEIMLKCCESKYFLPQLEALCELLKKPIWTEVLKRTCYFNNHLLWIPCFYTHASMWLHLLYLFFCVFVSMLPLKVELFQGMKEVQRLHFAFTSGTKLLKKSKGRKR